MNDEIHAFGFGGGNAHDSASTQNSNHRVVVSEALLRKRQGMLQLGTVLYELMRERRGDQNTGGSFC